MGTRRLSLNLDFIAAFDLVALLIFDELHIILLLTALKIIVDTQFLIDSIEFLELIPIQSVLETQNLLFLTVRYFPNRRFTHWSLVFFGSIVAFCFLAHIR